MSLQAQPPNPTPYPAIWSAVAATFSALASWLVLRIQRRTLHESRRPELMIYGWTRKGVTAAGVETIGIWKLKNVGKGAAFNIVANASANRNERPLHTMTTHFIPILPPGDEHQCDWEVTLFWKNAPNVDDKTRLCFLKVDVSCSDSRQLRYRTEYQMLVAEQGLGGIPVLISDPVAPDIGQVMRRVHVTPHWRINLGIRYRKLLGKVTQISSLAKARFPGPPRNL